MILNQNCLIKNINNNKIIVKNEKGNNISVEDLTINPNSIDVRLYKILKTYYPFIKLKLKEYTILIDYENLKFLINETLKEYSTKIDLDGELGGNGIKYKNKRLYLRNLHELEKNFDLPKYEQINQRVIEDIEKNFLTKIYSDKNLYSVLNFIWETKQQYFIENIIKKYKTTTVLSIKKENRGYKYSFDENENILLFPGILYLGVTKECIGSEYFVPMYEGRSSTGRLGLSSHVTAGFGDLGYIGYWTLEIWTIQPLIITPNMRIGQVYFYETDNNNIDVIKYKGKYSKQLVPEPIESKIWKDK